MTGEATVTDLIVLDVGHGNTTVIRSDVVVVVDAAPRRTLIDELERDPVDRIDHLVLSHADSDHIGGAIAALSHDEFSVSTLWLNPDCEKDSAVWGDLLAFAAAMNRAGNLRVVLSLNVGTSPIVSAGGLSIDVLHPDVELAARGPVGRIGEFGAVSSNAASAVLRVKNDGRPIALLAGDANQFAVQRMLEADIDLSADVLIFPHHGGHSDGDDYEFARSLSLAVDPIAVVFSLSRSGFRNPLPEIVRGVREGAPAARIACTQLSSRCCAPGTAGLSNVVQGATHWLDLPAAGAPAGSRCAGSLHIRAVGEKVQVLPEEDAHRVFIALAAPNAMCTT